MPVTALIVAPTRIRRGPDWTHDQLGLQRRARGAAEPTRKAGAVNLAANSTGGSSYSLILMMVLLFGAMYFLMIRPQQKRRRAMQEMQSAIGPGDEVITIGGLYGTVIEIDDETVTLEVAPGVTNRYAR